VPNISENLLEPKSPDESSLATSFAVRTLVDIAERRRGADAARCRLALLHFESATLIHRALRRALAGHSLSDLQFAVLVILFSTEPEPLSASELAEHAGVSRSAMTDALSRLEDGGLLVRTRDEFDRRVVYVRANPAGLETVDRAINDYLRVAEEAVSQLRPAAQRALLAAYVELLRTLSRGDQGTRTAATI
jgi:DNA-binding MarR family transcriptional regulator